MSNYRYEIFDRPGQTLPVEKQRELHASLRDLGSQCLTPLPSYQIFTPDLADAFESKTIVTAQAGDELIGFVSAIALETPKLEHPVIHSGLTCIHPAHRRSKDVLQQLFANLFLHVLTRHPGGVWMTTVTDIVSSLVHMSKYCIDNFPAARAGAWPSTAHVAVACEFSAAHRNKAFVSPAAGFDEDVFVFRGSKDWPGGEAYKKDIDDPEHWHRDRETSEFYRGLLRPGAGDEVLLVGFLDLGHLKEVTSGVRFRDQWGDRYAKL